jgi:DNA-binding SARP family transcriptional activator
MIRVEALGPVRVSMDGAPAPAELLWRKHLALLVYLARAPRRCRTRTHLVGLLWPEKNEPAARHSLNEALRILRKATGDRITSDAEQIALEPDAVLLDVEDLERRMDARDWAGAAGLVLGEFLEGFDVPGATDFEGWLSAERGEWRRRGTMALCRHAESLAAQARIGDAVAVAERALRLDPYSEGAMLELMRALALLGRRADALTRLDAFLAREASELGVAPGGALLDLAARIRGERGTAGPAASDGRDGQDELRRPPLAGRGDELSVLLASWHRAAGEGRTEVALVRGAPGLGASRLLEEVAARITLAGGVPLRIRAVAADRAVPWSGLMTLAAAGLADAPGAAASPPEAVAALARVVPEWAERFPGARETGEGWPLGHAFSEVVRTVAAEQPVALVVDDAHWLDPASLATLEALVRSGTRAPVWIGMRVGGGEGPDNLDHFASRLGRDVPGIAVELGPLTAEAMADLVRWAFPKYDSTETERLARRIGTDSAGIPLLAVELIYAIANGMEPAAAAWPAPLRTLDHSLPGELPATLVAAFRVSFRRLSPLAQSALSAVAVLGDRASLVRIAQVAKLSPEEAEHALDELEWTRWLESEPRGYAFVARIAREVVLEDMMTAGQRRRLEARAAGSPPDAGHTPA